ncbi:MAG: hypothetical protein HY811_00990 [Planctomycetes bacterium]|nr:hypothetical protein [Planctomycetota bacterium]
MGKLFSFFIVVFWGIMTFLYISKEVIPGLPILSNPSYETFLKNKSAITQTRMGIYFLNKKVGFSITDIELREDGYHKISNNSEINISSFVLNERIKISGYTLVNPKYQPDSFEFFIKSSVINYKISGKAEGNDMVVTVFDGAQTKTSRYENTSNATLSNGFSPFISMPALSVGKEWTITMVNPINGAVERVRAVVESMSKMEWQNKEYDVYEVVLDYKGFKPTAWITPDGRVLKEELIGPGIYFLREQN